MVERFSKLKFNVKALFYSDFHFDRSGHLSLFNVSVKMKNSEVYLLYNSRFDVGSVDDCPYEVSDPACDSVEGLVLLFEGGKLEIKAFIFGEEAGGFKFLGQGMKLCT